MPRLFPADITKSIRRPKMTMHRGRTWDTCDVIFQDGTKTKGWLDTTWGSRFHFEHEDSWYSGPIGTYDAGHDIYNVFDLRHANPL